MKVRTKYVIPFFALLVICPLFAGDELYTIKLERPVEAGYTYTIRTIVEETFKMVIKQNADDSVIIDQSRNQKLKFEADVKVLEVSKTGGAVSKTYVIKSFINLSAKGKPAILPKGTIIDARLIDGNKSISIDNKPVSEEMYKMLKEVISLDTNDKDDDEFLGIKKKVAIGEKWNIETSKIAEELSDDSLKIDKKSGQGQMWVEKKVRKNGIDCLKIVGTMSIKVLSFPVLESLKTIDSTVSLNFDGLYPVDTTKQSLDSSMKMSLIVKATGRLNEQYPDVSVEVIAESNEISVHPK